MNTAPRGYCCHKPAKNHYQLIVIGAGPAGLAAACAAAQKGVREILLVEREPFAGGILNQCIHNGFGLHYFHEELTGPEYAQRFIDRLAETDVELLTDSMVLSLTGDRTVTLSNPAGFFTLTAQAVILATGCRERSRGAIGVPGTRPAGVFSAGAAQRYLNMEGKRIGQRVLIVGSGDIGLIMARRLTLEGAKVLACVELLPYSSGLTRNIVQCLQDYDIPLYLSHTVTAIHGERRVCGATVCRVDEHRNPLPETAFFVDCDTILFSVGLIPENELGRQAGIGLDAKTHGPVVDDRMQTDHPGIFVCGNAAHVHDLVDFVSQEATAAGQAAADYLHGQGSVSVCSPAIPIVPGKGVS